MFLSVLSDSVVKPFVYFMEYGMDSRRLDGLALILLGLYWAGTLLALRMYHLPNFPLVWAVGMVPVLIATRSLSVLLELSILFLPWLLLDGSRFHEPAVLYFPLVSAVALFTAYRIESRALTVIIPVALVLMAGSGCGAGVFRIQRLGVCAAGRFLPRSLVMLGRRVAETGASTLHRCHPLHIFRQYRALCLTVHRRS